LLPKLFFFSQQMALRWREQNNPSLKSQPDVSHLCRPQQQQTRRRRWRSFTSTRLPPSSLLENFTVRHLYPPVLRATCSMAMGRYQMQLFLVVGVFFSGHPVV
ncbi:unnamed protein product, partial [Pylaiella littoralis]